MSNEKNPMELPIGDMSPEQMQSYMQGGGLLGMLDKTLSKPKKKSEKKE